MKIGYMSDLHLEFNGWPQLFIKLIENKVSSSNIDLQIIAGDVLDGTTDTYLLQALCNAFGDIPVVFVPGNHEHFGDSDPLDTERKLLELQDEIPNLNVLIRDYYELQDGRKIWGTTLWYDASPALATRFNKWADFRFIYGMAEHSRKSFVLDTKFLDNIREGDIVVSHMLPLWECVDKKFEGADNNCLFVRDVKDLIIEKKPAFWIHGHTHADVNLRCGETSVLCNPRGIILGKPENPLFDLSASFEY